ncbi:MAG: AraC family transcriptional regulator [Marinosulfonomonas sp.]|nr:AraC family transcriptional regulator [Marinosulfonomonas sp.]
MTGELTPGGAFRVVPLARFAQGGRWRTEAMRSYSQPVLLWFTKGQGRITVSGVTRGYGAHNAIFLPADTMHGFDMLGQVTGSVVFFPRNDDIGLPHDAQHMRFREARQHADLNRMIDDLSLESANNLPGQDRALMHHGGLLAVWLDRHIAENADTIIGTRAARRLVAAFTALVERDFQSAKSVADFAAELGVTPTHLSRVCIVTSGKPASKLLADRVHFEARRLLRETGTPVHQIATQLGFSSPAYFTRAFQKQTGMTPTSFRRAR